jgi:hypothetical protein
LVLIDINFLMGTIEIDEEYLYFGGTAHWVAPTHPISKTAYQNIFFGGNMEVPEVISTSI